MSITVALVAQGAMGAATGRVLADNGARVLTSLAGRSAASATRAREAGMEAVSDAELASADIILSIVPPGDALAFAERMAPYLTAARRKPVFIDCNAVSPATVVIVETVIAATGAPFVDAGIIGGPPKPGYDGPSFYCSGPHAQAMSALSACGLDVRVLEAPVGAASALKMSYAGITKGLTALGSTMMLAATRAGADEGLRNELAESQPELTKWFERQIPAMYSKAYRWVAEMREISEFVSADSAGSALFEANARFYERMAADHAGDKRETGALSAFLARKPEVPTRKLGYKDLLEQAEARVTTIPADEAFDLLGREDVILVDLRDPRELEREGRMPGAIHCPRGMLEFWIDPASPYHKPVFSEEKRFVFFCAGGWRSALAADVAQRMGLDPVAHIGGGFKAWKEAGGPVETAK